VVLAGIPAEERTSFKAASARRKGLTLVLCRRMKHTYPRAIRLVAGRRRRRPLGRDPSLSARARSRGVRDGRPREGLKVLVTP
jgi:L-iditol 2-dehydrogenase